jgi:hypothetical protein
LGEISSNFFESTPQIVKRQRCTRRAVFTDRLPASGGAFGLAYFVARAILSPFGREI